MTSSFDNIFAGKRPLFTKDIDMPSDLVVLCFAPHPDDFDAIAVTMRIFRDNGNPIHVGVVSGSWSGVEQGFRGATTPAEMNAIREEEQKASAAFFGLPEQNLSFLRLAEDDIGDPMDNPANSARVTEYFQSIKPSLVFCPHGNDSNGGHRSTYAMGKRAAAELDLPVCAMLNRDPKTIDMRHDIFTVFGEEEAAVKGEQLRLHTSQQERNMNVRNHGVDERVLKVNRQIASDYMPTASHAEVFEIEVWNEQ